MLKILLCCSAGMSTSLLVTKMQAAAKEQGIECSIQAMAEGEVKNHEDEMDVLLLGPQVRFLFNKIEEDCIPLWNNEWCKSFSFSIKDGWKVI